MIVHRLFTIRDTDLSMFMEHGQIIGRGAHDEPHKRTDFYADFYNSQFTSAELLALGVP